MVVIDGAVYLAGFALDDAAADYYGFVAHLDLVSGAVLATHTWNRTSLFDGFLAIATDGGTLYLAGAYGWDLVDIGTAAATLQAISLPLSDGSSPPDWTFDPPGAHYLAGVAAGAGPTGGVYAAGSTSAGAVVFSCDKTGACP